MPIINIIGSDILPPAPIKEGKQLDDDQTKTLTTKDDPPVKEIKKPHLHERLLTDSRISPVGSGTLEDKPNCTVPTSGQKWWAAIILGVLFALLSSPPAYAITSKISTTLGGMPLYTFTDTYPGQTILALFIHTLIFILIVRILLW